MFPSPLRVTKCAIRYRLRPEHIASKGHFVGRMPHAMQSDSEMKAIWDCDTLLAIADNGARLLVFELAFLRLALRGS